MSGLGSKSVTSRVTGFINLQSKPLTKIIGPQSDFLAEFATF
jgi:hypothetical protein